jgi:Domain of Unknown Function (DUF1521)
MFLDNNITAGFTEPVAFEDWGGGLTPDGIATSMANPLPSSTLPAASLPSLVNAALVQTPPPAAPGALLGALPTTLWSVENLGLGFAQIDLGGSYALAINEYQSEVVIENRATNTTTRVFGNAEVEVGGKKIFQFWGTVSFALNNGVTITANTVQNAKNPHAYMLDTLTVTNDDHALVITGVNDQVIGDLAVDIKTAATVEVIAPISVPTPAPIAVLEPVVQISAAPETMAVTGVQTLDLAPPPAAENVTAHAESAPTEIAPYIAPAPEACAPVPQVGPAPDAPTPAAASAPTAAPPPEPKTIILSAAAHDAAQDVAYDLDENVRDGLVLVERGDGIWLVEDESHTATQLDLNDTAIGADFAPGSTAMSLGEFDKFFSRFVMSTISFLTVSSMRSNLFDTQSHERTRDDTLHSETRAIERRRIIELQSLHTCDIVHRVSDRAHQEALAA